MAQVLIVANGGWPRTFNLEENTEDFSTIIALDGASNRLIERGIVPQVIIGDLDSISTTVLKHCKKHGAKIVQETDQELSDVSKGLNYAHMNFPTSEIYVIGIEIGRYDHHLAAYSALFECQSSAIILLEEGWSARRVCSTSRTIRVKPGSLVSLIPFGEVGGVYLKGCEFSLKDETLASGTRGVSNIAVESSIMISAESGDLLLLIQG